MTFFQVTDCEALAVLVRFVEAHGQEVLGVRPVNATFVVKVSGSIELTNQDDLRPYCGDLDTRRTFWEDIGEIHQSCVELLGVFA